MLALFQATEAIFTEIVEKLKITVKIVFGMQHTQIYHLNSVDVILIYSLTYFSKLSILASL